MWSSTLFVFFVISSATVGYGDIHPKNDFERLYCTVVMLLGATVFTYSVETITGIILQKNVFQEGSKLASHDLQQYLEQVEQKFNFNFFPFFFAALFCLFALLWFVFIFIPALFQKHTNVFAIRSQK